MIKAKTQQIDVAKNDKKILIDKLKNQSKELRTILAQAKLDKRYLILGFKSFDAYLKDCIAVAKIDMKPDYARRLSENKIFERLSPDEFQKKFKLS